MSSRRAADQIVRSVSRLRGIVASRRRKGALRGKAILKKMKRSGPIPERPRTPVVQLVSWFESVRWAGVMLFAYTIAWFAIVSNFLFN